MRGCFIACILTICAAPAWGTCPEEVAQAPYTGQSLWAAEPEHDTLDPQTLSDLDMHTLLLAEWNRALTALGRQRFGWLAEHPYLDVAAVRERQEAVRELRSEDPLSQRLREIFKADGARIDHAAEDLFCETSSTKFDLDLYVMGGMSCTMTGALLAFGLSTGQASMALLPLYPLAMFGRAEVYQARVRDRLLSYRDGLHAAQSIARVITASKSALLQQHGQHLNALLHSPEIRGLAPNLEKLWSLGAARPLNLVYQHSLWSLRTTLAQLRAARPALQKVWSLLGEMDALGTLAQLGKDSTIEWKFPALVDSPETSLEIVNGHNPFIALKSPGTSVANSARLGFSTPHPNFSILTGQNMGGKSTYLKMIALTALLAQMGAPVPAEAVHLTPLSIRSHVNVTDSIAAGKSYYEAESELLLKLVQHAQEHPKTLLILDEILIGTNPSEREAAVKATASYLSKRGGIYVLAIHDVGVGDLEDTHPRVENRHVEEQLDAGRLTFSYRVLNGVTRHRNAITVLQIKGFPEEIIQDARRFLRE